jgi:phosphomannomutase/phosphoglucomutase
VKASRLRADRRVATTRARSTEAREIITIDGLRVEYADGFGLARPSNTTPVVVLRFEADSPDRRSNVSRRIFAASCNAARPGLALPF